MRVVLDTNIVVRAGKYSTGPARESLVLLGSDEHAILTSPPLVEELERVLRYPRVRALHGMSDKEIDEFVEAFAASAQIVDPTTHDPPVIVADDPDDDAVLLAALVGRADVVCTLDRHLRAAEVREYCKSKGIEILSDVELLDRLRAE